MLTEAELANYLHLAFTPHLGPVSFLRLIKQWQHPSEILATSYHLLRPYIEKANLVEKHWKDKNIYAQCVAPALAWSSKEENNRIITLFDEIYPIALSEIYTPPPVLFLKGNHMLLTRQKIAIVGSRQATPQGITIAQNTAQDLGQQGICVVSGMASGIDAAAHEGALKTKGATIAVLGTGIDLVYPRHHRALAHRIAAQGLLISEFPLGTRANAANFPIRNRIMAGLSLATVVVEATLGSGSLITARLAMEQGKDVMAFPGSIFSQNSKGTHRLIKEGAKLIESSAEILEDLERIDLSESLNHGNITSDQELSALLAQDDRIRKVLNCMDNQLLHPDEISNLLQLSTQEVQHILLTLELEGIVQRASSGRFQRIIF